MELTPTKGNQFGSTSASILDQENLIDQPPARLKKPPPITPRRFNRFFTPRPRNASHAVRTSRNALRVISGTNLNRRNKSRQEDDDVNILPHNEDVGPRKKRKHSFISAVSSIQSSPQSRFDCLPSSQENMQSSPLRPDGNVMYDRRQHIRDADGDMALYDDSEDEEAQHDIEMPMPRITTYQFASRSKSLLHGRLTGRYPRTEVAGSTLWQNETGDFFSGPNDLNSDFHRQYPGALPFSTAACHTNPIVAMGDEEGYIRLVDSGADNIDGISRTHLTMRPHDNALMDLEFSSDDAYLATASGDQTCHVIDMHTQQSVFLLSGHHSSVKRVQFQPGSNNKILSSCGRDGQISFWDLRTKGTSVSHECRTVTSMAQQASLIHPVNIISDAHTAGIKFKNPSTRGKPNNVPGRGDFSITSVSFLGESRPHLLVSASEIDTVIKLWDMRTSYSSRTRIPTPVSFTQEPKSHELHRRFGVNSLAINTEGSRIYALSRDHTVYAYSTSHLVLGSMSQLETGPSKPFRPKSEPSCSGLGPLYGFRHPSLRVATFWPRISIRKSNEINTELIAVGSSDDCSVLFPTNERHLTKSTRRIASLHDPSNTSQPSVTTRSHSNRPAVTRAISSSFNIFDRTPEEDSIPIYYHGTPLIRGHTKEVTSLTWSSEGNLVTASDDYTVRCWRESPEEAREMRREGDQFGKAWKTGWASIGIEGFDNDD